MTQERLTLDATGWQCPRPIIETKRMLAGIGDGQITTLVDNTVARDNLLDFAQSQGYDGQWEEDAGIFRVTISKTPGGATADTATKTLVIVISTDSLGSGAEELGKALMKSYLFALGEADIKPQTLIFMNSGVFLPCKDSAVLETLQKLASDGVEIWTCGACLNFYGLTEALAVGKISNMYQIVNAMNEADNTIKI